MRRVVVTGVGVVSAIGIGVDEFTAGLRAGRRGARPISVFDTEGFAHAYGCEVVDFAPKSLLRNLNPTEFGRAAQFAAAGARMAIDDAGLDESTLRARRCAISIGTTDGGSADIERLVEAEVRHGSAARDPVVAQRVPSAWLPVAVASELRLSNVDTSTVATACGAGNYAIGNGFDAVRFGDAELAIVGGADAMCRMTFTGFYRLGAIAPDVCRPFDAERKGILTGEGAGVLMLEPLDSALARGARVYAEVHGYGLNCDAFHQVAPKQDSVAECIRLALRDAGIEPAGVDLISAHGTGTKANDVTEVGAIRDVYGDAPPRTVSMKSMLGHTMGAASALAAIGCALAITHGFIPPTINHRTTDPNCAIDCVPNHAIDAELNVVQNNGLAFGGNNCVLVLGRYES
ncbi:MAG: beta-ketoacyl-[acyl-carrier-protein] synthase family protein [Sciscionella sp.]|nr:beta-ketoacyl-[acyl-carrier-protein] synthase family protein [Sciscionella sp.]